MKPEKISHLQMWKLRKQFPATKTEHEQLRILKRERQEDIKAYLTIINLLVLATILIYVLYLMLTYKW